jgi:hypothetical protein
MSCEYSVWLEPREISRDTPNLPGHWEWPTFIYLRTLEKFQLLLHNTRRDESSQPRTFTTQTSNGKTHTTQCQFAALLLWLSKSCTTEGNILASGLTCIHSHLCFVLVGSTSAVRSSAQDLAGHFPQKQAFKQPPPKNIYILSN